MTEARCVMTEARCVMRWGNCVDWSPQQWCLLFYWKLTKYSPFFLIYIRFRCLVRGLVTNVCLKCCPLHHHHHHHWGQVGLKENQSVDLVKEQCVGKLCKSQVFDFLCWKWPYEFIYENNQISNLFVSVLFVSKIKEIVSWKNCVCRKFMHSIGIDFPGPYVNIVST